MSTEDTMQTDPPCHVEKLRDLFESAEFSDVTFEASDGTKIPAHRNIISMSPVLKAMFDSSFVDGNQNSVVRINGMDGSTLRLLLSFMYGFEVNLSPESVKDGLAVLEAAHKYDVAELTSIMDSKLCEMEVDAESLIDVLKTADRVGAGKTKLAMFNHIVDDFEHAQSQKLVQDMILSLDQHDRELAAELVGIVWRAYIPEE
ncbi:hypothetical protein CLOM_g24038 [Closterium sp. NIES-68]|nr:hypothetical protein CLOM_g24038 [Closterium sp. NIES-68]GJP85306.1 hypothetical protein CLOP_g15416 [Closterium sp. NIES-67]